MSVAFREVKWFFYRTLEGAITAMCLGFLAICAVHLTKLRALLPVGVAAVGFLVGGTTFLGVSLLTSKRLRRARR